jgi:23S rRNA pseudouridine2604 synthase
MRINKYMSESGACSRRVADAWIEAGRVRLNGQIATLGSQVHPGDEVLLDGRPVGTRKRTIYIALNKPRGITSTTAEDVADNIVAYINYPERIFPIGRLDKFSEGLILLTNDGDIVNKVLRVENNHEKEYLVTVDRPITDAFVAGMASGVRILGRMTNPCVVTREDPKTFRIILTQGLNRQIRRMCEAFDYRVRKLQRVRIMHVELGDLPYGKWRELTHAERERLLAPAINAIAQ